MMANWGRNKDERNGRREMGEEKRKGKERSDEERKREEQDVRVGGTTMEGYEREEKRKKRLRKGCGG